MARPRPDAEVQALYLPGKFATMAGRASSLTQPVIDKAGAASSTSWAAASRN